MIRKAFVLIGALALVIASAAPAQARPPAPTGETGPRATSVRPPAPTPERGPRCTVWRTRSGPVLVCVQRAPRH